MKLIRKYRRRKWKKTGLILWSLFTIVVSGIAYMEYGEIKEGLHRICLLEERLKSFQREVYVAKEKMSKGTVLTEENVYRDIRYSDQLQELFTTEEELGCSLALDIPEGTCITASMLCPVEENRREVYFSEVDVPEFIKAGDRVDIRIRYGNAEDYIVLADKIIRNGYSDSGIVLELIEEELLFLSSAIADAEYFGGTKLYAVRYPEYTLLEEGRVTYIPKKEVLAILGTEKTEGESRTALEKRLMQCQ